MHEGTKLHECTNCTKIKLHGVILARGHKNCTKIKLHEGSFLHEDIFARGDTFARRLFSTRWHVCTEVLFSTRWHFCMATLLHGGSISHKGKLLLEGTLVHDSIFALRYFCMTSNFYGDIFAMQNLGTMTFRTERLFACRQIKCIFSQYSYQRQNIKDL